MKLVRDKIAESIRRMNLENAPPGLVALKKEEEKAKEEEKNGHENHLPIHTMPFMNEPGICYDLETLGVKPGCVITSIGAVKFTFAHGITSKFKVNIDVASAEALGMHSDPKTLEWWSKQSPEAQAGWKTHPDPIHMEEALVKFIHWVGETKGHRIYANGASFDFPILAAAMHKIGKQLPWKYSNEMCMRTVYAMMGFQSWKARSATGDYHDSLGDAVGQTLNMIKLFNKKD